MFREMRRSNRVLSRDVCEDILDRATAGVLAVAGDGGYPYAVPMSYARDGQRLLFHSATSGHKLDAIAHDDKASFCVIDFERVAADVFTTYYRSVIVFGRARVLTAEAEKRQAMRVLVQKYAPHRMDEVDGAYAGAADKLVVLEMTIEHIAGKESPEPLQTPPPQ